MGNGEEGYQERPDQPSQPDTLRRNGRICSRCLILRNEVSERGLSQLWAVIYPIDMIKSRMQTDGFSATAGQKYKSTLDCVRTVWRTEGISAFTRGLGPTLIR